jgi:hypothetical protein
MACPHLKEVVMLFCDAYPVKKMLPLDRIATANPCLGGDFHACPLFKELMARLTAAAADPLPDSEVFVGARKEGSR